MRLTRLELFNFRGFASASIEFPESGIVLLVGPNNAGKSALLAALDRLRTIPEGSADDTRAGASEASITVTLRLDDDERRSIFGAFGAGETPIDAWLATASFRHLVWTFAGQGRFLLRRIQFDTSPQGLAIVADEYQPGKFRYVNLDLILRSLPGTLEFDQFITVSGELHSFVFNQGNAFAVTMATPFSAWRTSGYHFAADRRGTSRTRSANATPTLDPSGENLPEALLWTHTNRESTNWATIRRILASLIPDLGTLQTPTAGGEVQVAFEDATGTRNLKDLGSGVEQLLLVTYVGVTRPDASIVIVEEPERDLHPDAQRLLLDYVRSWSEDRLFVLSTHSSVFLDRAETASGGTWLVRRRDGVSQVSALRADLTPALDELGVRLSDVLSAERVLLVEGPSDRDVIEHWFGRELHARRAVVVEAGGGDGAWDAVDLERWTRAANKLPQRVLFLRDRDELDDAAVRVLEKGPVRVLPAREMENLLLIPHAIAEVIREDAEAARLDPTEWDERRVQRELAAAADGLKALVVLNRVAYKLAGVRALPRKDLRALRAAPSLKKLQHRVVRNLEKAAETSQWWEEADKAVSKGWERDRLRLAPGEEVLDAIWRQIGRRYVKERDAIRLAREIPAPPELTAILAQFLSA